MWYVGIDTGGTFTDFVAFDGQQWRLHKRSSTPADPASALLAGLAAMDLLEAAARGELRLIHGTTVATNAFLEGKLAKTVYVTNAGFEDVLMLGRQARGSLYRLHPEPPSPDPFASVHAIGVNVRMDAAGNPLTALTPTELARVGAAVNLVGAEVAAINLLHSFVDDSDERLIQAHLADLMPTSRASEVLPEAGEYERGVATFLNAALTPSVSDYLLQISNAMPETDVQVMQSSGGSLPIRQARDHAVRLLLSGPAGGINACQSLAGALGIQRALTFDMGGTSTDVALFDGSPIVARRGQIGSLPLAIPMLDIHTVGAGGGSIAWVDSGGFLQVGPHSAGAVPGPACYGRGGNQATVTDAQVVLGRISADSGSSSGLAIQPQIAERVIDTLAQQLGVDRITAAQGVISLADEHMAQALRAVSISRGHDPREFALLAFGGAAGLHACALADALQIPEIYVPAFAGVLSAFGMLAAPPARFFSRACGGPVALQRLRQTAAQMRRIAEQELSTSVHTTAEISYEFGLDLRYRGQTHSLNVSYGLEDSNAQIKGRFAAEHERVFGHRLQDAEVEVVSLTLAARGISVLAGELRLNEVGVNASPKERHTGSINYINRAALIGRQRLWGPAVLQDDFATTWIPGGWLAELAPLNTVRLRRA